MSWTSSGLFGKYFWRIGRTWLWKCKYTTVHSCSKIGGIINIHLRVFVSFWCDEKRLWAIFEIPPAFPLMQTSFFCRHIIVHSFHKRWKTWSAKKQTHNKSLLQVNDFQNVVRNQLLLSFSLNLENDAVEKNRQMAWF